MLIASSRISNKVDLNVNQHGNSLTSHRVNCLIFKLLNLSLDNLKMKEFWNDQLYLN